MKRILLLLTILMSTSQGLFGMGRFCWYAIDSTRRLFPLATLAHHNLQVPDKRFYAKVPPMPEPLIDVISPNGFPTGVQMTRKDIHKQGKLHRAVHLYLFNQTGESILLQQRSLDVDHYPGAWSISVTGHIDAKESATNALWREMEEELALTKADANIEYVFSYRKDSVIRPDYVDCQIHEVFVGRLQKPQQPFKIDKQDVQQVRWFPFSTFKRMVFDKQAPVAEGYKIVPVYQDALKALLYYKPKLGEGS